MCLLAAGGCISSQSKPTLFTVVKYHDITQLEEMVEAGEDINQTDENGWTPLHVAAADGREHMVGWLITHGAKVDAKLSDGRTPLYLTSSQNDESTARLLVQKGADPFIKTKSGWSALDVFAYNGKEDFVREVLAGKEKPPVYLAAALNDIAAVESFLSFHSPAEAPGPGGTTLLHWATKCGRLEIAELLLQHNADAKVKDQNGNTPLHTAVLAKNVALAKLLLEHGSYVNAKAEARTPLFLACQRNDVPMVQLLLKHKASTYWGHQGQMPLHIAIRNRNYAIAEALLHNGADRKALTPRGDTPFELAIMQGDIEIATLITDMEVDDIKAKAKTYLKEGDRQSAAKHFAAAADYFDNRARACERVMVREAKNIQRARIFAAVANVLGPVLNEYSAESANSLAKSNPYGPQQAYNYPQVEIPSEALIQEGTQDERIRITKKNARRIIYEILAKRYHAIAACYQKNFAEEQTGQCLKKALYIYSD